MRIFLAVFIVFFNCLTINAPCFAVGQSSFDSKIDEAIGRIIGIFSKHHDVNNGNEIKGNSNIVTKSFDLVGQPFDSISAMDEGEIEIYVAKEPSAATVSIITDSNLMPYIEIYVKDKTLHLSNKEYKRIRSTKRKIIINIEKLQSIYINDACKVTAYNIKSDVFFIESNDASKVNLSGNVGSLLIEANDASQVDTTALLSKKVEVSCSDSAKVFTKAIEELNIEVSDTGVVRYYGNLDLGKVKESISDAGKILHFEKEE